jgi:tubulin polyglutamylase TTLL6/13
MSSRSPKRKTHRRKVKINLSQCHNKSVLLMTRIANKYGWEISEDLQECDIVWTGNQGLSQICESLMDCQRVNLFPRLKHCCSKAVLSHELNLLAQLYPDDFNFFPRTYDVMIKKEFLTFQQNFEDGKIYILKTSVGSQGAGITLANNWDQILASIDKNSIKKSPRRVYSGQEAASPQPEGRGLIVQEYLCNPLLLDGYKFDLRVYVMLESIVPLRYYLFRDGLARICTQKYRPPTSKNLHQSYMHLTNYSINKFNPEFAAPSEVGTDASTWEQLDDTSSKRSIRTAFMQVEEQGMLPPGVNGDVLWDRIDKIIGKTLIAMWSTLWTGYTNFFPFADGWNPKEGSHCFQLLGFDVLLDAKGVPWLLEVNANPSLETASDMDLRLKQAIIETSMELMGYIDDADYQSDSDDEVWSGSAKSDESNLKQKMESLKERDLLAFRRGRPPPLTSPVLTSPRKQVTIGTKSPRKENVPLMSGHPLPFQVTENKELGSLAAELLEESQTQQDRQTPGVQTIESPGGTRRAVSNFDWAANMGGTKDAEITASAEDEEMKRQLRSKRARFDAMVEKIGCLPGRIRIVYSSTSVGLHGEEQRRHPLYEFHPFASHNLLLPTVFSAYTGTSRRGSKRDETLSSVGMQVSQFTRLVMTTQLPLTSSKAGYWFAECLRMFATEGSKAAAKMPFDVFCTLLCLVTPEMYPQDTPVVAFYRCLDRIEQSYIEQTGSPPLPHHQLVLAVPRESKETTKRSGNSSPRRSVVNESDEEQDPPMMERELRAARLAALASNIRDRTVPPPVLLDPATATTQERTRSLAMTRLQSKTRFRAIKEQQLAKLQEKKVERERHLEMSIAEREEKERKDKLEAAELVRKQRLANQQAALPSPKEELLEKRRRLNAEQRSKDRERARADAEKRALSSPRRAGADSTLDLRSDSPRRDSSHDLSANQTNQTTGGDDQADLRSPGRQRDKDKDKEVVRSATRSSTRGVGVAASEKEKSENSDQPGRDASLPPPPLNSAIKKFGRKSNPLGITISDFSQVGVGEEAPVKELHWADMERDAKLEAQLVVEKRREQFVQVTIVIIVLYINSKCW